MLLVISHQISARIKLRGNRNYQIELGWWIWIQGEDSSKMPRARLRLQQSCLPLKHAIIINYAYFNVIAQELKSSGVSYTPAI